MLMRLQHLPGLTWVLWWAPAMYPKCLVSLFCCILKVYRIHGVHVYSVRCILKPGAFQGSSCIAENSYWFSMLLENLVEFFPLCLAIGVHTPRESMLSLCFPWYLSLGALYLLSQAFFLPQCLLCLVSCVSHITAGVWFCSAARKLLEVNVYKQGDALEHVWICSQSVDSSGG